MDQLRAAGRIGNMSNCSRESGFTLIEALVSFIVLTVGVLGALLFHSTLLSESGDNKARLEAIQIAEGLIEQQRAGFISETAFNQVIASLSSASSSSGYVVAGKLNNYLVSFSDPTAVVSGSSSAYKVDVTVSWPNDAPTNSLTLVSYLGFVDPQNVIPPDEAGGGAGENSYTGNIPLPSGTMTALDRLEITELEIDGTLIDQAEAVATRGAVSIFKDINQENEDEFKVVIETDGKFIQIGSFDDGSNEFMLITGRLYNDKKNPLLGVKDGQNTKVKFGYVQGEKCSDNEFSNPFPLPSDNSICFESNIIDLSTTAGANCIIGRFENDSSDKYGLWADYICVAGTGWNGSIEPYARTYEDSIKKIDLESGGGEVCSPKLRSYRYYLLEANSTSTLNKLLEYRDFSDWSTASPALTSIKDILDYSGATVAGQSGLVRFTADETSSGEQVPWNSYFWVNPNYIVSPGHQSASLWLTPSFAGPSTWVSGTNKVAASGYGGPVVTSGALSGYQAMLPGDIAHQNFYMSSSFDCSSLTFTVFGFADSKDVSATDDFLQPYHLASAGYPGGIASNTAYRPITSGAIGPDSNGLYTGGWFDQSDFNTAVGDTGTGVIVLGYSLATERIKGTISFVSAANMSADNITVGGKSSSIATGIQCSAILGSEVIAGSTVTYEYYCATPEWWQGEIFAYVSSGATASSAAEACSSEYPPIAVALAGDSRLAYAEEAYTSDSITTLDGSESWSYFQSAVVSAAKPQLAVYSMKVPYAQIASDAESSLDLLNFRFTNTCP